MVVVVGAIMVMIMMTVIILCVCFSVRAYRSGGYSQVCNRHCTTFNTASF